MSAGSKSVFATVMREHLPGYVEQGLSSPQIAEKIQCSPATVSEWRRRLKLPEPPVFWTEEREKLLRFHWGNGLSGSAIGERLGCSKSAVIAKARRLNLKQRGSPIKRREQPTIHPSLVGAPGNDNTAERRTESETGAYEKQEKVCQWPFGDPGQPGFRFCGKKIKALPYCDEHRALAWIGKK